MFLEIFGMGIETILYCFIADEEMFAVNERFAEPELIGTITNAQSEQEIWKQQHKVSFVCILRIVPISVCF